MPFFRIFYYFCIFTFIVYFACSNRYTYFCTLNFTRRHHTPSRKKHFYSLNVPSPFPIFDFFKAHLGGVFCSKFSPLFVVLCYFLCSYKSCYICTPEIEIEIKLEVELKKKLEVELEINIFISNLRLIFPLCHIVTSMCKLVTHV